MYYLANVQRDATHRRRRAPEHGLGWHVHQNFQLRSGGGLDILGLCVPSMGENQKGFKSPV